MNTLAHLNEIRKKVQAKLHVLNEARARRDTVLNIAATFAGTLRVFRSGSLATGFVNHPVNDGDGGMVLDRRVYPTLGPDGRDELPYVIVDDVHDHLREPLREVYPNVRIEKMKRGVLVKFNDPIDEEQDPTVDLVVALNRQADDALWIPNLDKQCWDPSHPEKHVALFLEGSADLRQTRAWTTRIGKAWNQQWEDPAFCSFNIAALVREAISAAMPLDEAVAAFFAYAALAIEKGPTQDPAGVSEAIRLPLGKEVAVDRLSAAAAGLRDALANDGDPALVTEALAAVFPDYIDQRAAWAAALRDGNKRVGVGATSAVVLGGGVSAIKTTRSFGAR